MKINFEWIKRKIILIWMHIHTSIFIHQVEGKIYLLKLILYTDRFKILSSYTVKHHCKCVSVDYWENSYHWANSFGFKYGNKLILQVCLLYLSELIKSDKFTFKIIIWCCQNKVKYFIVRTCKNIRYLHVFF